MTAPGPTNSLLDVAGLRVGHVTLDAAGWLSGVSVVLAPRGGMTAGVDVRGGGPGTRETDLLDPGATVERVHAIVLSGGSAYGLAAASGVADALGAQGVGLPVGAAPEAVVPIVPAAVVFDLGRGGSFANRPGPEHGAAALRAATADPPDQPLAQGCVGAGTGTVAGGFKGGVGTASAVLDTGATVAAFVVLNAMGSILDERTGELLAARSLLPGELPLDRPDAAELAAYRARARPAAPPFSPTQNTTLAVVATDATVTKAQCRRLAGAGHDGLARAVNPVHTLFDGDTIFGVGTGARPAPEPAEQLLLLQAAAECVTRAIAHAVVAARSTTTAAGSWSSYRDTFPSGVPALSAGDAAS